MVIHVLLLLLRPGGAARVSPVLFRPRSRVSHLDLRTATAALRKPAAPKKLCERSAPRSTGRPENGKRRGHEKSGRGVFECCQLLGSCYLILT